MNQNKTLIILTTQVVYGKRSSEVNFLNLNLIRWREEETYEVKAESIAEHELPVAKFTSLERVKRARECEDELVPHASELSI
jgi:hypothetical protein